jgi:hypothetical protein
MCVQAEFIQKRIVAHSFSIRDSVLEEQEITACGKIFEEEGLFGVHVANERERRPVVLVGRNTKKTRLIFHSLVGDFACVRGRPFLAQKNLALLTDSASIARASPHEVKLHVDSHDPYSRDPEIRGKSRAKEFIDTYRNRTKEDQIEILTDHILFLDSCAEKNKWDLIKDEVDPDPKTGSILTDFDPEWAERYGKSLDVEMIECCDTLNALIGETKDRGFFQKIFRKGANPSNMYMDRKNDFSELRQGESYNGDEDLELDML